MIDFLTDPFLETLQITFLVLFMLMLMDWVYIYTRGRIHGFLQSHPKLQYLIAAFLGAIPGCEGAFLAVSLYAHNMISLGALFAAFIATTGDEAFVMLSLFPLQSLILFSILFLMGIIFGWLLDWVFLKKKWANMCTCEMEMFHPHERFSFRHYFGKHLWEHLIKKHMGKIFLWTFIALIFTHIIIENYNFQLLIRNNPQVMIFVAGLIGLFPQSGPHLLFVNLFAKGGIIFPVLFTNMFIQNGHALLPLLSISLRDSILLKIIGAGVGILLGLGLYLAGIHAIVI